VGIFSAIAAVFKLVTTAISTWVKVRIFKAGIEKQKNKQLRANEEARDDEFEESEDWKSSGGMLGGVKLPDSDKDSD
jgi:hypothetical protein